MALSTPAFLRGRKGGGSYKNTPDTIRSEDTVEIIMGVGEGRNFGLAEGAKSFIVGGTTLVAADGVANFKDFELREYTGIDNPGLVTPMLGGFGSPTQANASSLATGTAVIRTGQLTQIDFLDFRFAIQGLYRQDKKGSYADTLKIKIEFRPSLPAGQPWQLAWSTVPTIPTTPTVVTNNGEVVITRGGRNGGGGDVTNQEVYAPIVTFAKDDVLLRNEANPGPPIGDAPNIWINPANGQPYKWIDGSWVLQVPFDQNATFYVYEGVVFYKDASRPPANPSIGDVWATPPSGPPVRYNGSSWIQSLAGSPTNYPYTQPMQGGVAGILEVNRKISSVVIVETRVPVSRIDVPYDIRITKVTGESSNVEGDNQNVSEVGWESFEEILAEGRQFPNTHILQLIARAGDQFTSLPELMGDVKGRMVNVPTNYDPLTRTYAGVWDGLFKEAWTDNGAWCTRDFIKNERYGLSSIYPYEVNEANFYAWAQWCDEAVVDNLGGSRPRWTYNDTLDQPRPAREQVNYMAGSCGGRLIDDGDGVYDVLIDKPEPISMIFGPESVIDGEFVYSFTDIQTRANWVKVGFVNSDLDWGIDFRVVKDPDHIAEFGRIPLEFVATGKTNLSEAMAAARLRLITNTTEFTACTFKTNRVGRFLFPFQTIGLCDPDMGWGVSGRISEKTGARQVRLRDAVFLEAGIGYKVTFNRATSPISTVTMTLVPGQLGSRKVLDFTADLPLDIPEFAQFSLESYDAVSGEPIALPKAFKILTISPADGDSEAVELTVLELNRFKQAYVEGNGEPLPAEEYSAFNGPVIAVANPRMTPNVTQVGGITTRNLIIEWDRPTNPFARNTIIEYSRDGAEFVEIARSTEFYELENVASGVHVIRLSHIHNDGIRQSRKVMLLHEITSEHRTIPPVVDLHLTDEPNPPEFESISPLIRWAHGDPDPNFATYKVTVSRLSNLAADPFATDTVWSPRITKPIPIPEFIFEFDENVLHLGDAGEPRRAARISVFKTDDYGNDSPATSIVLVNSAPAKPEILVEPVIGGFNVTLSPTTERDVVAALIDLDDGEVIIDGNQTSFFLPVPGSDEHTIKAAYYDRFSKADLNWSDPIEATPLVVTSGEIDTTAPEPPTNVLAAPVRGLDNVGNPTARVTVGWTPSVSTDVVGYQVEIVTGGRTYIRLTGTNFDEFAALMDVAYVLRVRAFDRVSNFSTWVSAGTITPTRDTTPPAVPTDLVLTPDVGGFRLTWTSPFAIDLRFIKVYHNTSNSPGTATLVTTLTGVPNEAGEVFLSAPVGVTRYYWLRAQDTSNNLSAFSAVVSGTVPTINLGQTPPATPTGLSGSSSVSNDARGNPVVRVIYTWVANTETDLDGYQVEVTEDGSPALVQFVGTNRFELTGLTGRVYRVRIRAVDTAGSPSAWTSVVAVTGAGDTVAPDAPTGFTANVSLGSAYFSWTNAPQSDVDAVELWTNASSHLTSGATKVTRIAGQRAGQTGGTSVAGLPTGSFRYYWLRSVDTSGNISGFSDAVAVTAPGLGGSDLPSALVATPTGLAVISYISVNPTTNVPESRLFAEWTQNAEAMLGGYDVEITETGFQPNVVRVGSNRFERLVLPTQGYSIRVRAFDRLGAVSPWTGSLSVTGAKDNVAPSTPTSGHLIFSPRTVFVRWAAPADADVAFVEVWYNYVNDFNTAQLEGRVAAKAGEAAGMSKSGLTTGQAVWVWLRAIDTSGNYGPFTYPISGIVPAIGVTEFASSIRPVELFPSDSAAGAATGDRLYFNTTDRRLRRAKNGEWTSEVTGADITANSITAGQIAAGAISTTQLAADAVTTDKLGANAITAKHIAVNSLAGDRITAGTLNADRIAVTGALPIGLTVGPTGATIGSIQTWANDPAQRVNDLTTVIAPGRISVTGGLTLDSWRDNTEIRGGAIKANSIMASKLTIGNRQLDVGLIFTTNSPGVNQVSWSAGHIAWTDEGNNTQVTAINAGTVNWNGGWTAIWWNRGTSTLQTGEVSTPAYNGDDILLAVYRGGTNMAELYGRTTIEGDYIRTGTLNARTIAAGAITADKIVAGEVTMEKLSVTGALPLTLTMGSTGVSIQQAGAWANDPLTRAGQVGTRLGSGFIELSGGVALSSWQQGGDLTRINGGQISANSIRTNSLSIGNRGIEIAAVTFGYIANSLITWTAGTIVWENDAGQLVGTSIAAGSANWTGGFDYIYWNKGEGILRTTLTQSVATSQNSVCLATYQGGHLLNSTYGRTMIEGGLIQTATLDANRIISNTITSNLIQAGAISADKLTIKGRGVSFDRFAFRTEGDTVYWINGRANYVNGFGTAVQTEISAGQLYWPQGNDIVVLYWVEGETFLRASQYPSVYNAANCVMVGTYYGGGNFTAVAGSQTIIDGSLIKTGAITAAHIAVGSISADRIAAGTITADKLVLGGINYDRLAYGASGRSSIYYHATPFGFGPGSWQAIMGVGVQPQAGSPVVGNFSFIATGSATTTIAIRVVRNSDQTVVWGHGNNNGCEFEATPGGRVVSGIFFDSTRPNAGRQQYDVQVYSYSQSVACGHRTMTLKELSRDGIDEIQLYVPAYTGVTPGAGSSGGGNINGQTSGDGGTVGTNGNTGWGGGGLAETLQAY